ncbi:hypothetical protein OAJ40_01850 [Candidatus Pelagibacter sp.]|nr:hypothetical protein [Candidatus Pelagibacter sp.]
MKNLIFTMLSFIFLFSCTVYNEAENLNLKKAESAHTKLINMNNDLSYDEYKSLIIDYAKSSKFPDINK